MRWVPSDDEAVPFFPHLFPNVGVSILEESSLRLQNCRLAVGSDCCIPGCVLQEKRQGKRLPLHNIAPSQQHLGDATHFSEGAAVKGAGNNSGRHDSSAGVFRGARGVSAKNQVTGIHCLRPAPNPRLAGRQAVRAKARRCCVSDWWQPSDPQGLSRPLGVKFGPVGRRGRPTSTPPLALEEDVPQSSRFLTQGTQAFGSFGSGKESALPHRSKASKVVGPLGLRPKEAPGHGPVNASSGSLAGVLLRNPVIGRMLKQPVETLFHTERHGEAGLQGDSLSSEVPKTRSAQGSLRESPCQRSAGVHRVVLQIRDHGGDRTFDKGPSFGGRLKLIPSNFHNRRYLSGTSLEKRSLCRVRQCCKTMVRSGSQQLPSPRLKTTSTLPSCCLLPAWAA